MYWSSVFHDKVIVNISQHSTKILETQHNAELRLGRFHALQPIVLALHCSFPSVAACQSIIPHRIYMTEYINSAGPFEPLQ